MRRKNRKATHRQVDSTMVFKTNAKNRVQKHTISHLVASGETFVYKLHEWDQNRHVFVSKFASQMLDHESLIK